MGYYWEYYHKTMPDFFMFSYLSEYMLIWHLELSAGVHALLM